VRRTPLKRISDKKRRQDAELAVSTVVVKERSGGRCEARLPCCTGRGQHVHHLTPRSVRVDHSPENLLDLCFACHTWIHDHGTEARERGLLVGSVAKGTLR
jgi:hypothetical protein